MKAEPKKPKFIPCDENSQIYSWQGTNKKAKYLNLNVDTIKKTSKTKKK